MATHWYTGFARLAVVLALLAGRPEPTSPQDGRTWQVDAVTGASDKWPAQVLDRSTIDLLTFDPRRGEHARLSYRLDHDGWVRVRICWRDDPSLVLRTLLDWVPQKAGRHELVWDGRDASGHLVDNTGCLVTFVADDRRHATHDRRDCEEFVVEAIAPSSDSAVANLRQVRGRIKRSTSFAVRHGLRLRVYLDYGLVAQSRIAGRTGVFALPPHALADGREHLLILNVDDGEGHVGVASAEIRAAER